MHYDFKKDVLVGEQSEKKFAYILLNKYPGKIKNIYFNKNYRYDVLVETIKGRIVTFEVKYDMKANQTGNIAIETFSRGKLSGINKTQANYYVIHCFYEDKEHFYVFKTDVLRDITKSNLYHEIWGGDKDEYGNFTSRMVLLRLKDILKNMKMDLMEA